MSDDKHETVPVPQKLHDWLSHAVETGASDLHIVPGYPPILPLHGDLIEMAGPALSGEETRSLLSPVCPAESLAVLEAQKNVDFSFDVDLGGRISRFRANLFHTGRQLGGCLRV